MRRTSWHFVRRAGAFVIRTSWRQEKKCFPVLIWIDRYRYDTNRMEHKLHMHMYSTESG